jgi:hypothetical protein
MSAKRLTRTQAALRMVAYTTAFPIALAIAAAIYVLATGGA